MINVGVDLWDDAPVSEHVIASLVDGAAVPARS
jgi:hypothetical protein